MRTFVLLPAVLIFALNRAAAAAVEEPAPVQWGDEVSDKYRVWDWISAYLQEDADSWRGLSAEEQSAQLKKAETACARSNSALAGTREQTDAAAIMAMPDAAISHIEVCLPDGASVAPALKEKKTRLLLLKQKADAGTLSAEDMKWLEENRLELAEGTFQDSSTREGLDAQKKQQAKINAAAEKKYASLKDKKNLGSGGLNGIYDGTKGGAAEEDGAVSLSKRSGGEPSPLKTGDRSSKKKLSFAPPPEVQLTGEPKEAKKVQEYKKAENAPAAKKPDSSYYDYKVSKIFDGKAKDAAQTRAQEEKKVREAEVGVAIATREEHEKITKSLINHSGIGGALPVLYDFVPGGVAADCITGKCTDGSGAWGKGVQVVTGTKAPREVGGGNYTRTEIACAGLGDLMGDLDAFTLGLTKYIPLPSACNKKNGSK